MGFNPVVASKGSWFAQVAISNRPNIAQRMLQNPIDIRHTLHM